MNSDRNWWKLKYPQNCIIRKPLLGGLIISILCFVFIMLYKPLGVKASQSLSYEATMALYCIICGLGVVLFVWILKLFRNFQDEREWTIMKELLAVFFVTLGVGIVIYIAGFIIEGPAGRLNFNTFLDSIVRAFLIGIVPFLFFTLINYYYLFPQPDSISRERSGQELQAQKHAVKTLTITSQLKKESLSFHPDELIYAESDGNYVVFHLFRNNLVKKEIIRNSINNIEQQLSEIPYFVRTHRAFIVNLKKVVARHGTTLGYRLKLEGSEHRIPVSRSNTVKFNQVFSGQNT